MQVVDQLGMVVAPALAGLLIGSVHLGWVYGLVAAAPIPPRIPWAPSPRSWKSRGAIWPEC